MQTEDFVYVGFNSRVAALDRRSGEIVWDWRAPTGVGYVSLLVDGDRVFVAVQGYQYCLDARTGEQYWFNPMTGFGFGVTCLSTARAATDHALIQESQQADVQDSSSSTHFSH